VNPVIAAHARVFACSAISLLCGCSYVPQIPGVTPYRIAIQQGNFISQEMVSQLKTGMTREQVRFVLGTPLVTDIFHADRWDYVYYREVRGDKPELRRVSVFFEQDKLARVSGDVVPAAAAAPQEAPKAEAAAPETEKTDPKN